MSHEEFRALLVALNNGVEYGAQTAAAAALGAAPRSIREYCAGARPVPETTARLVRVLIWAQQTGQRDAVLGAATELLHSP